MPGYLITLRPAETARQFRVKTKNQRPKTKKKTLSRLGRVGMLKLLNGGILGSAGDFKDGNVDTGEILNEAKDNPGGNDANKTKNGRGEGRAGDSDLFWIVATKKIFKTTRNEHGKKSQTCEENDDRENVGKETFKTLNGGNIGAGGNTTTNRPVGLGIDWSN